MSMKDSEDMVRRKAAFLVRTEHYLSLGYDRIAAADFVAETGGRLSGPALDIGTGKGLMAMARQALDAASVPFGQYQGV
jgi:ubiquinone/menaquinone biosynthesis C-methylase UbiE